MSKFNIGNVVIWKPRSSHDKQMNKIFGPEWVVLDPEKIMPCFTGELGIHVVSLRDDLHIRNIRVIESELRINLFEGSSIRAILNGK